MLRASLLSEVRFFGILERFMSGHSHKPEEKKPADPGQEKILNTLGHLRAHLEDGNTIAGITIDEVTKTIRARTREALTGHPIEKTNRHYKALDTQLGHAQKVLRQNLTDAENAALAPGVTVTEVHKSRITEAKKKVQEAAEARKIAAELRVQNPDKVKKHHEDHDEHHEHEEREKRTKERQKWYKGWSDWRSEAQEALMFEKGFMVSKFINVRVIDNFIKGKGSRWNPLTWPSRGVQLSASSVKYALTSIPEHKYTALAGAGLGTAVGGGIPLGLPLGLVGAVAFSTIHKMIAGKKDAGHAAADSHGHDAHGGGHH